MTSRPTSSAGSRSPRNSQGWDGKLRVVKTEEAPHDPSAPSPPESENDEEEEVERKYEIVEGEEIKADEGVYHASFFGDFWSSLIVTVWQICYKM